MVTASFTTEASKNADGHVSSSCTQAGTSAATSALRMAVYVAFGSFADAVGGGKCAVTALTAPRDVMRMIHFDHMSACCANALAHVSAARTKLPLSTSWPTYLQRHWRVTTNSFDTGGGVCAHFSAMLCSVCACSVAACASAYVMASSTRCRCSNQVMWSSQSLAFATTISAGATTKNRDSPST